MDIIRVGGNYIDGGSRGPAIVGNGQVEEESRDIGPFHAIEIRGIIHGTIVIGDTGPLIIQAESNILPLIETRISGNSLSVGLKDNVSIVPKEGIEIRVATPTLARVTLSGTATLEVVGEILTEEFRVSNSGDTRTTIPTIRANRVRVALSGTAKATVGGESILLKVDLSGSGHLHAETLRCAEAKVEARGVAQADVHASRQFFGEVSGTAKVVVHGNPAARKVRKSGVGSIRFYEGETMTGPLGPN